MKVAIYARISTANNGQSVEMQLRDLRQLAQQRGFEIVAEFCDEGVSGAKDSRPQLDRMPGRCEAREIPGDIDLASRPSWSKSAASCETVRGLPGMESGSHLIR